MKTLDKRQVECMHGPLDGTVYAVREEARRIFYAPAHNRHSTYWTLCTEGDEDAVPVWQRRRLLGRYYIPKDSDTARWVPYE